MSLFNTEINPENLISMLDRCLKWIKMKEILYSIKKLKHLKQQSVHEFFFLMTVTSYYFQYFIKRFFKLLFFIKTIIKRDYNTFKFMCFKNNKKNFEEF